MAPNVTAIRIVLVGATRQHCAASLAPCKRLVRETRPTAAAVKQLAQGQCSADPPELRLPWSKAPKSQEPATAQRNVCQRQIQNLSARKH